MAEEFITIEVAYAHPDVQRIYTVQLLRDATVRAAIAACDVLRDFPDADPARDGVGIFSKPTTLDTPLREGDRVEIYRKLIADPKQARKRRAEVGKVKRAKGVTPSPSGRGRG